MQSMNLKCFRKRKIMFNDSWHSRRDPSIKDPRSNAAHDYFFELSQTWQKGIALADCKSTPRSTSNPTQYLNGEVLISGEQEMLG